MTRTDAIHAALQGLEPSHLQVFDDSAAHHGHAGAASGKGHFRVEIASGRFDGLSLLACHRVVYDTLAALMESDIHALQIQIKR
jgi:BolA protein